MQVHPRRLRSGPAGAQRRLRQTGRERLNTHAAARNNDGEIIDQALSLRELTGQPVILAADDYTHLYRAAPAGLAAVLMPRPDEA